MNNEQIKEAIIAVNNNLGLIETKGEGVFIMADCRTLLSQISQMIETKIVNDNKEDK